MKAVSDYRSRPCNSNYHLCTTALKKFHGKDSSLNLMLGAWCVPDGESNLVLPYPFDDRQVLERSFYEQNKVYEFLIEEISCVLNCLHGEKNSSRYWRLLVGPWLYNLVQIFHERYMCLLSAAEQYSSLTSIWMDSSSFKIPFDFNEHFFGLFDDPYNLQIYSLIAASLKLNGDKASLDWSFEKIELRKNKYLKFCNFYSRILLSTARFFQVGFCDAYVDLFSKLKIMIGLQGKAVFFDRIFFDNKNDFFDDSFGEKRSCLKMDINDKYPGWAKLLAEQLPLLFPISYLEGYKSRRRFVKRYWSYEYPKILISAIGFECNEAFKWVAAHRQSMGTRLIAVQHGGNYGTALFKANEYLERTHSDEYWSWGWEDDIKKPIFRISHPKLVDLRKKRLKAELAKRNYFIFVANEVPRYHYRTVSMPVAGQYLHVMNWRQQFFSGLNANAFSMTRFRPYPSDRGWESTQALQNQFPSLTIDDGRGGYGRTITEAKLVICDANQTTWLESLSADIPTVIFLDRRVWEIHPRASKILDELSRVGILFYHPHQAAEAVNSYATSFDVWNNSDLQECRKTFVQEFALSEKNWKYQWRDRIKCILGQ